MDCLRAMLDESCDPPGIDRQKLLRKDVAEADLQREKGWWWRRMATLKWTDLIIKFIRCKRFVHKDSFRGSFIRYLGETGSN